MKVFFLFMALAALNSPRVFGDSILPPSPLLPTAVDPNSSIQAAANISLNYEMTVNTWANTSMLQIANAYAANSIPLCYAVPAPVVNLVYSNCLTAIAAVGAMAQAYAIANNSFYVGSLSGMVSDDVTNNGTASTLSILNASGTAALALLASKKTVAGQGTTITLTTDGTQPANPYVNASGPLPFTGGSALQISIQMPDGNIYTSTYTSGQATWSNLSNPNLSVTDSATVNGTLQTILSQLPAPPAPPNTTATNINPGGAAPIITGFTGVLATSANSAIAGTTASSSLPTTTAAAAARSLASVTSLDSLKIQLNDGQDAIGVASGNLFNMVKAGFNSIGNAGGFITSKP